MTANDKTIDTVNDLIETCKDGEYGFQTSAEQVKSPSLRATLQSRAADCRRAAEELQAHVAQLGGEPEDSGSAVGAMHRGWVAVKAKLSTYDDLAVLEECERGEDRAMDSYRKALDKDPPPTIRSAIEQQYAGVKRNHDMVRGLRNGMKATG